MRFEISAEGKFGTREISIISAWEEFVGLEVGPQPSANWLRASEGTIELINDAGQSDAKSRGSSFDTTWARGPRDMQPLPPNPARKKFLRILCCM